ncbi:Uncharacterised protein [Kluyvera cryocrescens]|uniref:Uncharacterized protein n=1 Tax=Kluyvera cryocrescens TaxID=580 RepID=A0A485BVU0_KLUCR|nr:Uncharacterised protein [Kluyvera cryocrescens]
MRRIKTGGQDGNVNQIAKLLLFEGFDQFIALRAWGFTGNQRCIVGGQQAGDLPGVFDGAAKIITPFARLGELNNLADNVRRNAPAAVLVRD